MANSAERSDLTGYPFTYVFINYRSVPEIPAGNSFYELFVLWDI